MRIRLANKLLYKHIILIGFLLLNVMQGQSVNGMQFQVFINKSTISGDAYDIGNYNNPSGFGFDFIFGSHISGLIGLNVSFAKSDELDNHGEKGGVAYLMHVPIGVQYNFNKWKYNPYLKASYSIISAYSSSHLEIRESGGSLSGGDYLGGTFMFAIGYNWKINNWFGIGLETGYGLSTYNSYKHLNSNYDLPSTLKGQEIYFRIPVIFLGLKWINVFVC